MLGVHSLAPAKLYSGNSSKAAEENPPAGAMADTQTATAVGGPDVVSVTGPWPKKQSPAPGAHAQTTAPPGITAGDDAAATENTTTKAEDAQGRPESSARDEPPPPVPPPPPPPAAGDPSPQERQSAPGSSEQRPQSLHSYRQQEPDAISRGLPDETHANAIKYKRDPETVIAYLVPLPKPVLQGTVLDVPQKYLLYAPPPPPLIKPAKGQPSEGYVRKLNRHWQQSVRKAKKNAHNGKRFSFRGIHSKCVRACLRGMDKLKYDDVIFLARIEPKTVEHLILIHPYGLSAIQTPEEILSTFRKQMFASKKRAKRDSIISGIIFLPALIVDTGAVFFGGLAEIDGLWMLVSISAYRTARIITRKMDPEPKTLEIQQEQLIQDAQRVHEPPVEEEKEEDSEPNALRRSMDKLRKSMGSARHRMSQRRGKKVDAGATSDSSRPGSADTPGEPSGEPAAAEQSELAAARDTQDTVPQTGAGPATSGMLEHFEEEEEEEAAADNQQATEPSQAPTGGIFAGDSEENGDRALGEPSEPPASKSKGHNFQLTFYPSPAMEVLAQYVQASCHMVNGQSFPSPIAAPSEQDVLDAVGWHPERRQQLETAEQQEADEQWQSREVQDDLRLVAAKAAKQWKKDCRKYAKSSKRSASGRSGEKRGLARRFRVRRPQLHKGKAKEPSSNAPETEKLGRVAVLKQRFKIRRDQSARRKTEKREAGSKGVGAAAALCIPFTAIAARIKKSRKDQTDMEGERDLEAAEQTEQGAQRQPFKKRMSDKRGALRRGLSTRSDSLRQRLGSRQENNDNNNNTSAENPGTSDGQFAFGEFGAGIEADAATPAKKSKRQRVQEVPAAVAAAIGAALKKTRRGKKDTPSTAENTTESEKPNRFSALREKLRSLRTRVTKSRDRSDRPLKSRFKTWFEKTRQKRQRKSTSDSENPRGAKEHGAIAGLFAACFVFPAAKVKEMREKRRKPAEDPEDMIAPEAAPAAAIGTRSASSVVSPVPLSYVPPIAEEDEEVEMERQEQPFARAQYLPGHGQSEIPVGPERRPAETNSHLDAQHQAHAGSSGSPAAAVAFRSIKDGIGKLKPKKRETEGGNSNAGIAVERAPEAPRSEAATEGRFKSIKDGINNIKAKRGGSEKPPKDKVYKESSSGFIERMRWLWLIS